MKRKTPTLLEKTDPGICIRSRLAVLSRNVENIYRKHLKPFNITTSQLNILFFIGKSDDVRQKDIGNYLQLERSTVSRDLRRLVDTGWIARKESDARSELVLTDTGTALVEEIIPSWKKAHKESSELLGDTATANIGKLASKFRG